MAESQQLENPMYIGFRWVVLTVMLQAAFVGANAQDGSRPDTVYSCAKLFGSSLAGRTCITSSITLRKSNDSGCIFKAYCRRFDGTSSASTLSAGHSSPAILNCDGNLALRCEKKRIVSEEKERKLAELGALCESQYTRSEASRSCRTTSVGANYYREGACNIKAECEGPRARPGGWSVSLASRNVPKLVNCQGVLTSAKCPRGTGP